MNYQYQFKEESLLVDPIKDFEIWKLENDTRVPTENKYDLSKYVTHIYDQGFMGTSAATALCGLIKIKLSYEYYHYIISRTFNNINIIPSRLYIHNLAKILEQKSLRNDSEPTILACITALTQYGFCDESKFDYNTINFGKMIPIGCFHSATVYKWNCKKLPLDLNTFKVCLRAGNAIIMGICLYNNSNNTPNGLLVKPLPGELYLGNHVIVLIGYDDDKHTFKFVNSLGNRWGIDGKGFIMYDYALDEDYVGDVYTLI